MKYIYVPILARNVWFGDLAESKLTSVLELAANANVRKWITRNLRNWIINKATLDLIPQDLNRLKHTYGDNIPQWIVDKHGKEDIYLVQQKNINNIDKIPIEHIIDYLNEAKHNVSNMSVPQVLQQVREWDDKLASKHRDATEDDDDDRLAILKKYSNGYRWVSLTTRQALKREGDLMGHCVGGETYYNKVAGGRVSIFSLRDANNKPHVTIEYDPRKKMVLQIKGKKNEPPIKKYRPAVVDLIVNSLRPANISARDCLQMGYLYDTETKTLVSVSNPKDTESHVTIDHLDLESTGDYQTIYLPNLTCSKQVGILSVGNLYAANIAAHDVLIDNTDIVSIGTVEAERSLVIQQCKVGKIKGKFIAKAVDLSCLSVLDNSFSIDCEQLVLGYYREGSYILSDTNVRKSLSARGAEIALRDNVHINGELDLRADSEITSVGKNCSLPYLDLMRNQEIDSIPSDFRCRVLTVDMLGLPSVVGGGKLSVDTLELSCDFDITELQDLCDDVLKSGLLQNWIQRYCRPNKLLVNKSLPHYREIRKAIKQFCPKLQLS